MSSALRVGGRAQGCVVSTARPDRRRVRTNAMTRAPSVRTINISGNEKAAASHTAVFREHSLPDVDVQPVVSKLRLEYTTNATHAPTTAAPQISSGVACRKRRGASDSTVTGYRRAKTLLAVRTMLDLPVRDESHPGVRQCPQLRAGRTRPVSRRGGRKTRRRTQGSRWR
jgi:hypothetical protein